MGPAGRPLAVSLPPGRHDHHGLLGAHRPGIMIELGCEW
jgi:hypothetical protein